MAQKEGGNSGEINLAQFMGFPETLAQTTNTSVKARTEMKFRNYHKYVSKDTLQALGQDESGTQHASEMLQEVPRVERLYQRKVAKAVRQQLKNEIEPIACLRPVQANIDLKRGLQAKLDQLQVGTERSLLELLKEHKAKVQANKDADIEQDK